jgi:hypothetical protein
MKHVVTLTITLIIAVLALTSLATADVPQMINYQGYLTDENGDPPPNDDYLITFRIYDAPEDGNIVWEEIHPAVHVTDGFFHVILGDGTPQVPIGDDVFNQPDRWLGIRIEDDPELTPRTRLVTVPYAFRISTVDGATGGTVTSEVTIYDNDAATNSGGLGLEYAGGTGGTFTLANGTPYLMSGAGQQLRISTVDGGGQGIVIDNNDVGIGTTTPAAKLHDNGSIYTLGGSGDADLNGGLNIADFDLIVDYLAQNSFLSEGGFAEADMDGDGRVTLDDATILERILFYADTREQAWRWVHASYGMSSATGDDVFYVRGKEGIGTNNPAARLHDNGSIYTLGGSGDADLSGVVGINDLTLMVSYLTQTTSLSEGQYAEADLDGDGRVTWDDAAILERIVYHAETKDQAWRLIHSSYGVFPSTGGDVFYVRGRVGIGTNNPQGALDVNSTTGALIVPRMTTAERNALTAVNGMIIYNTTTDQFNFYENGAWVTK